MFMTVIFILIIFSGLVIAHEWGHFIAARRSGVKVEEFGIGFPPRLLSRKKGKTIYSINLLPIGGFVRLKGEDGQNQDQDSFAAKPYKNRAKIILAGVAMNLLVAYGLIVFLLSIGMPAILPTGFPSFGPFKPAQTNVGDLTVLSVNRNSAAEQAGIKVGEKIIKFNGKEVKTTEQLQQFTEANAGNEVIILIQRGQTQKELKITLGNDSQAGFLGVATQPINYIRYPVWAAPVAAIVIVFQMAITTIAAFGGFIVSLFTKAQVSENVAGPIGIVAIFSNVVQFDWQYILAFMASISLSLSIINALPIPALDGGRFLVMSLNRVGLRITPQREQWLHLIGFVILMILVIIVSISDISKLL